MTDDKLKQRAAKILKHANAWMDATGNGQFKDHDCPWRDDVLKKFEAVLIETGDIKPLPPAQSKARETAEEIARGMVTVRNDSVSYCIDIAGNEVKQYGQSAAAVQFSKGYLKSIATHLETSLAPLYETIDGLMAKVERLKYTASALTGNNNRHIELWNDAEAKLATVTAERDELRGSLHKIIDAALTERTRKCADVAVEWWSIVHAKCIPIMSLRDSVLAVDTADAKPSITSQAFAWADDMRDRDRDEPGPNKAAKAGAGTGEGQ